MTKNLRIAVPSVVAAWRLLTPVSVLAAPAESAESVAVDVQSPDAKNPTNAERSAAEPPEETTGGEPEEGEEGSPESTRDRPADGRRYSARRREKEDRWIDRWPPTNHMAEFGIYGGVWFPNHRLELFEPNEAAPDNGFQRFNTVAPDVGLRAGYYPLRFVGIEAEGGVMPTRTVNDAQATVWTVRGHIVGQLGLWSVTPFLVAGVGILGVSSDNAPNGVGREQDVTLHFGGGVKVFVNRWVQLRLDVRDVVSNRRGVGEGLASSPEVLLGVSFTLRRKRQTSEPKPGLNDSDGDGVLDRDDFCPEMFGEKPRGCPTVCIDDNDGDGWANPEDQCPEEPETRNGYEDNDGCPDEVPPELEDLAGVMEGINFDTDKATIKPGSMPVLDRAVEVMKNYPEIRVKIVGHTDDRGAYTHNLDLSQRRAAAVRDYLVEGGVSSDRISTDGVGPDQPIETNETPEGRAKNRRIEFILLDDEGMAVDSKEP